MEYLHNDKEQFREAIALTGYQTGVAAEIIEKDYYVTMIEGIYYLVGIWHFFVYTIVRWKTYTKNTSRIWRW